MSTCQLFQNYQRKDFQQRSKKCLHKTFAFYLNLAQISSISLALSSRTLHSPLALKLMLSSSEGDCGASRKELEVGIALVRLILLTSNTQRT